MLGIFNSLLDNYKTKIRNPFIGTFASVWLIRNWNIVYAFFMFEESCTMQDKINYINNYFHHQSFWIELRNNLLIVFGVLILTYILYAISRALTNLYYKIAEPWIINLIDRKEVVTREEKKLMLKEIDKLTLDLESSREINSKIEARNRIILDEKQHALIDNKNKISMKDDEILKLKNKLKELEKTVGEGTIVLTELNRVLGSFEEKLKNSLLTYIRHNNIESVSKINFKELKDKLYNYGIVIELDKVRNPLLTTIVLEYYRNKYFLDETDRLSRFE
jgi:hypothetical protein